MQNTKKIALLTGAVSLMSTSMVFAATEDVAKDATTEPANNTAAEQTIDTKQVEDKKATEDKDVNAIQEVKGKIDRILFSGNKKNSSDELMKHVTHTTAGMEYDREALQQDVRAILASGLVENARAKVLQNNGETYAVFEVKDMENVKTITFEGNTLATSDELMAAIVTKEGDEFLKAQIQQDSEKIQSVYSSKGFVAIISGVNNIDGNVTYTIREAKVGDVMFSNNKKTKDWVLHKVVDPFLQKGAFLRNDNLQGAYTALSNTGYFSTVGIQASDMLDDQGAVALNIDVKETSTGAWNIGGAYSDTYGIEAVGGIYDKNLGGTAKSLGLDFGIGTERDHYTLTYTDPYWRKSNTSVYAKAFKTDKDVDNDYFEYTEGHTGGEVGFIKPISKNNNRTQMYANVRIDKVEVSEQERGQALESIQENSVTLGITHDGRNLLTGSGTIYDGSINASLEAIGSDMDFTKFSLGIRSYKALSSRDMLAARGVFNYSPDTLPGIEQFTIGGTDTVRGLEEDEQRGDKSVLGTIEFRHNFSKELQGVVFADVGKAWSDEIDNDLAYSAGIGLRITTALGVLRLDVAKANDHSQKVLFGIGQSF